MRAIDLYAGIGGWSLGFKMAGIEVVKSYEWWPPAARTLAANLDADVAIADIRNLPLDAFPRNIDIVIGSPPCTQFSYANRGGSGDIEDGLKDLTAFFSAVEQIKPRFWAMENVPRVQKVLQRELENGGRLARFQTLFKNAQIETIDMSEFGLPQRRSRCVAGNFDFALLRSYKEVLKSKTLGEVVADLQAGLEPVYYEAAPIRVFDNDPEAPLNSEEFEFNRAMKVFHPVYNGMPFPDPLDRTSRTITATCTRVSRESIVIPDTRNGSEFRRLTIRERASLQGFPATYQFHGRSQAEKQKMIGNAIPPVLTYLIANSMLSTKVNDLALPSRIVASQFITASTAPKTTTESAGKSYPADRTFRFAIPNLGFKSGTRFELSNLDSREDWQVHFFFGDSKHIHKYVPCKNPNLLSVLPSNLEGFASRLRAQFESRLSQLDKRTLQVNWTHRANGNHPFDLLNALGDLSKAAIDELSQIPLDVNELYAWLKTEISDKPFQSQSYDQKLRSNIKAILVGIILGSWFNGWEKPNPEVYQM